MKQLFTFFLLFFVKISAAQDIAYAKKIVDTLGSSFFWGRGYTNDGMAKAAHFLSDRFKEYGLQPVGGNAFFQKFSYPVNTYPGAMEVAVNGVKLIPGKDFIISPESVGKTGKWNLVKRDSLHYIDSVNRIIIVLQDKLTWSVSMVREDYTAILVNKKSLSGIAPTVVEVNISNHFDNDFKAANICGIVKGTTNPDSVIFITAHYDHLGGMGNETYFPGANDNAGGVALLLNLAKYCAENPQPYSIAFIAFAGEEAGLVGSKYFTEHPLIPLDNIRFLINLDMIGTGEEGITVVNATAYPKEYALLNKINASGNYLTKINARGKAANSDHYWFSEKNVPSFFIYTMGGIKTYHDIDDKPETLPLTEFSDLFRLLINYIKALQ